MDREFRSTRQSPGTFTDQKWRDFASRLHYHRTDITDPQEFTSLRNDLLELENKSGVKNKQIAYLATTPDLFVPAVESMSKAGIGPLCQRTRIFSWRRSISSCNARAIARSSRITSSREAP